MSSLFRLRIRALLAAAAVTVALPLAGCNSPTASEQTAAGLPDFPATLPMAMGEESMPVYAPGATELPAAAPIGLRRVAETADHYAYADDAWGFADAIDYAPPDYGFYYDEVEPWAWQGYDDSMLFIEPLDYGYRSYYYRPGDDYPYFIRDPYWGYGYDDGSLVVVYDSFGGILPYEAYGPRFDYASRYYYRGRDLYWASRRRHPVIAANWLGRRDIFRSYQENWTRDRWQQPEWRTFNSRYADRRARYWGEEKARRRADSVRFAAWREQDFRTPAPPRAIPARWTRADWARDERRFAAPSRGYRGDRRDQERAATRERMRFAEQARQLRQRDQVRADREAVRNGGERAALLERRQRRTTDEPRIADRVDERRTVHRNAAGEDRRLGLAERRVRNDEGIQRRTNASAAQQRAERRRAERVERAAARGGEDRVRRATRGADTEQRRERQAIETSRFAQQRAERRAERGASAAQRRQAEVSDRRARVGQQSVRQDRASHQDRISDQARTERQRTRNEARERGRQEAISARRMERRQPSSQGSFETRRAQRQQAQVEIGAARREAQPQRGFEARQARQSQREAFQARSEQRVQERAARAERPQRQARGQERLAHADSAGAGASERRQRRERFGQ